MTHPAYTDTEELADIQSSPAMQPVPVTLTDKELALIRGSDEFTPVFSAWQTIQFQGQASETQPQPLLPADLKRRRAYVQVRQALGTAATAEGSVTSPGINAQITNIGAGALAPGWYTVNWNVELDGTVSATDVDNFVLKGPGLGGGVTSNNDGAIGRYPQNPVVIYVPFNNATSLAIRSVAAGTVGAVYSGQITLTPLVVPGGFVLIGQLGQVSNGQGGRVYAGDPRWEIRGHGLLYIAGDGITALNATLLVERDQGE